MSNYFELYKPKPFYTVPFIEELILYISNITDDRYTKIFYGVLQWVRAVISEDEHTEHIICPDSRTITAAAIHAENNYKAAVSRRDFADVTRWRYIMCAVRNYRNNHYKRGEH